MTRDKLDMSCEVGYAPSEAAFIADLPVREVQKAIDEEWFDSASRPRTSSGRRALGIPEVLHLRLIKDTGRDTVFRSEAKKTIHRQLRERLPRLCYISWSDAHFDQCVAELRNIRFRGDYDCVITTPKNSSVEFRNSRLALTLVQCKEVANVRPETTVFLLCGHHALTADWGHCLHRSFDSISNLLVEPVRLPDIAIDAANAWKEIVDRLIDATAAKLTVISDPEIRGGEPVVRGTRIPAHLLLSLSDQGAGTEELLADYPALDEKSLKLALLYARTHPRVGRPKRRPWQTAGHDE
jgi:uncharacterized protein (DUF433 family)